MYVSDVKWNVYFINNKIVLFNVIGISSDYWG